MSANLLQTASPDSSAASHDDASREFLTFRLGSVAYGADILKVREIRGYEKPTRIVGAPENVHGVLNLRDVIIPIVDLRRRFGLDRVAFDPLTVTIILAVADRTVGAVVDSVSGVVRLAPGQIKPMPAFNTTMDARFILGIGAPGRADMDAMLVLLDIEKLMTGADMGLATPALH